MKCVAGVRVCTRQTDRQDDRRREEGPGEGERTAPLEIQMNHNTTGETLTNRGFRQIFPPSFYLLYQPPLSSYLTMITFIQLSKTLVRVKNIHFKWEAEAEACFRTWSRFLAHDA